MMRAISSHRSSPETRDAAPAERRNSGGRARVRDRLMDRATRDYPRNDAIGGGLQVENLLLFIDDDLRETALSLTQIESYLVQTLGLLEAREITKREVHALASNAEVLDHLDSLHETLESLRRRLSRLAAGLR